MSSLMRSAQILEPLEIALNLPLEYQIVGINLHHTVSCYMGKEQSIHLTEWKKIKKGKIHVYLTLNSSLKTINENDIFAILQTK